MTKPSTDKTTKSLVTGPKSPSQETITPVTVQALASPLSVTTDKTTSSQTAQHRNRAKKTESMEEQWAHKATEAVIKAAKATVSALNVLLIELYIKQKFFYV